MLTFVQKNHTDVESVAIKRMVALRDVGACMTLTTCRGVLLATILELKPEMLEEVFSDGSTFRASDAFMRKWMHRSLNWSRRKGTRAAQKLPSAWETDCSNAILRIAYLIKYYDIPTSNFVNSDQTQVVFAPGDKMTWAETGAKQIHILGKDEKCAFTLLVSVSSDGKLLTHQAVYAGLSDRSLPSPAAPFYAELVGRRFVVFIPSGNKKYWSTQKTMREFVNNILAPHFDMCKAKQGLPPSQQSVWLIDVWSVHRSLEFQTFMRTNHPTIIVCYIPGGCTGVLQPCDVGIQRPLKLSLTRSYHEDVVTILLNQFKAGNEPHLPDTIGALRDGSVRWLLNATKAVDNEDLIKKV